MDTSTDSKNERPPFAFLARLAPLAAIVVLAMILAPQLCDRHPLEGKPYYAEPPIAMKEYRANQGEIDTLFEKGLREFGRENYGEAGRFLAKACFLASVGIKEKKMTRYPDDLRFFLGLAHFYRGKSVNGIPLLEEEETESPGEEKYPWYLAHLYMAVGRNDEARVRLERVIALDGARAPKAREKLARLPSR